MLLQSTTIRYLRILSRDRLCLEPLNRNRQANPSVGIPSRFSYTIRGAIDKKFWDFSNINHRFTCILILSDESIIGLGEILAKLYKAPLASFLVTGDNVVNLIIKLVVIFLIIEKVTQHTLTAFFFLFGIEGIGTPDIGPWIQMSSSMMAILNIVYAGLFVLALLLIREKLSLGLNMALVLSVSDIIFEFTFHGIGYITISVVVATVMIILIGYWKYVMNKKYL